MKFTKKIYPSRITKNQEYDRKRAASMTINRITVKIAFLVVFAFLIAAGLMKSDIKEVVNNAKILCFSCIGIK